jgi:hypothetical protein
MNTQQIQQAVYHVLEHNSEKIGLMSQYSGGWEGWLQCELSVYWPSGTVEREVPIWGDRRACDLWFPETKYAVELKCFGLNRAFKSGGQPKHISDINSTYTKWAKEVIIDAKKIEELETGYNGLSIVIIPTWLPPKAFALMKAQLSELTYRWEERGGFFIALRLKGWL